MTTISQFSRDHLDTAVRSLMAAKKILDEASKVLGSVDEKRFVPFIGSFLLNARLRFTNDFARHLTRHVSPFGRSIAFTLEYLAASSEPPAEPIDFIDPHFHVWDITDDGVHDGKILFAPDGKKDFRAEDYEKMMTSKTKGNVHNSNVVCRH